MGRRQGISWDDEFKSIARRRGFGLCVWLFSQASGGVTPARELWIRAPEDLRLSLNVPLVDERLNLRLPLKKARQRFFKSSKGEGVEPLFLRIPAGPSGLEVAAQRYAKAGAYRPMLAYLSELSQQQAFQASKGLKVKIDRRLFNLLDLEAYASSYSFGGHRLHLKADRLRRDPALLQALLSQLEAFLSPDEQKSLVALIQQQDSLPVDRYFLPLFAKKLVHKFVIYQGLNCFHAALAFHGRSFTQSPFYNVTREHGYHQAMINYDELWRALNSDFYPIDHTRYEAKYGDIMVFMDIPRDAPSDFINFRWIRHASVYLFNGYTFAKGSKSADTPYAIKTLDEEWQTWSRLSKNLAVKIFRRSLKHVKKRPPKDLTDWMY